MPHTEARQPRTRPVRTRLNFVDKIMLPLLLIAALASLTRLGAHYEWVDANGHPTGMSWGDQRSSDGGRIELVIGNRVALRSVHNFQAVVALVGVLYLLYQVVRVASPLLAAGTTALLQLIVPFVLIGPTTKLDDWWINTIWDPLEHGLGALIITAILAGLWIAPVAFAALIAYVTRRIKRHRAPAAER